MAQEIQNVMKEIKLEKVVLNMGLGKSGDAVEIAKKALGQISGKKVKYSIRVCFSPRLTTNCLYNTQCIIFLLATTLAQTLKPTKTMISLTL